MSQVHFFLEVKNLIDRSVTPSPPPEINHRNTINTKKMMDVANSTQRHHNFLWRIRNCTRGRSTGSKFGQHSIVPLVEFKGYLTLFWVTLTIHNLVWSLCYLNTVPSLQPQLILVGYFQQYFNCCWIENKASQKGFSSRQCRALRFSWHISTVVNVLFFICPLRFNTENWFKESWS